MIPYLVIPIVLVASWLLLRYTTRQNLEALGFTPADKRIAQLLTALLIGMVVQLLMTGLDTILHQKDWVHVFITPFSKYVNVFLYQLTRIVTDELIFRGALLVVLIHHLGTRNGIWISALCFAVYRIFPFSASVDLMIYNFLSAGLLGAALAYSFTRSGSVLVPIGINLALTFTAALFYSSYPAGRLLFMENLTQRPLGVITPLLYTYMELVTHVIIPPLLIYLSSRRYLTKPKPIVYIEV